MLTDGFDSTGHLRLTNTRSGSCNRNQFPPIVDKARVIAAASGKQMGYRNKTGKIYHCLNCAASHKDRFFRAILRKALIESRLVTIIRSDL